MHRTLGRASYYTREHAGPVLRPKPLFSLLVVLVGVSTSSVISVIFRAARTSGRYGLFVELLGVSVQT